MTSTKSKIRVAVLCGGQSAEHDVSLASGKNIADALDQNKYTVTLVGIDRTGIMRLVPSLDELRKTTLDKPIDVTQFETQVALVRRDRGASLIDVKNGTSISEIDVVFPILHGPYGEDGTLQGYLKFIGLPFVGPSILGSAVGMDKDVTKRLLRDADVRIGKFKVVRRHDAPPTFQEVKAELGTPFFLKPVNMGSSIGVFKVLDEKKYQTALREAFQYDTKVILEEFIDGREIECAVIGYKKLEASPPGEIIPHHDFYSYEAKYLDENGAGLELPAKLTETQIREVRETAVKVCQTLECHGLSRVDFFLRKKDGVLFVNEINTMPGFTKISMYPKMMGLTGRDYSALIDELISLAIQRREEEAALRVKA